MKLKEIKRHKKENAGEKFLNKKYRTERYLIARQESRGRVMKKGECLDYSRYTIVVVMVQEIYTYIGCGRVLVKRGR